MTTTNIERQPQVSSRSVHDIHDNSETKKISPSEAQLGLPFPVRRTTVVCYHSGCRRWGRQWRTQLHSCLHAQTCAFTKCMRGVCEEQDAEKTNAHVNSPKSMAIVTPACSAVRGCAILVNSDGYYIKLKFDEEVQLQISVFARFKNLRQKFLPPQLINSYFQ